MGVQLEWGDEQHRYLCFTFVDPWEWEELHLKISELIATLPAEVPKDKETVPILVDLHGMHSIPLNAIYHSRLLVNYTAGMPMGKVIIVGANNLMRVLHSVLLALGNKIAESVIFFDTRSQAVAYINTLIQDDGDNPTTSAGR